MSVAKASGGYFPLARVVEVDVRDFRRPADAVEFKEPRHHLEPYIELIDQLCDGVASTANGRQADAELRPTEDGTRGLEGIRSVTGASAVLVRQYTRSGGRTVARSFAGGGARRIHESELLGSLEDRVRSPETFARRVPAVFAPPDEGGLVNAAIVGERGETTTVIYLAGVEEATAALDDVGCRMLAAFHRETSNGKPLAGHSVRAALIDHLRREGGYAPATLYEDRLALFDIQLRDLLIVFQPVIDFHKYELNRKASIHGWEALARVSPNGPHPPGEQPSERLTSVRPLLDVAELWGPRFMARLDSEVFSRTMQSYCAQLAAEPERTPDHRKLSINCFPHSLDEADYIDSVRLSLAGAHEVRNDSIVLEISEKYELPDPNGLVADERQRSMGFLRRLAQLSAELGVHFAIDDFGSDRASPIRLDVLRPSYVKIDRGVVQSRAGLKTLKYVVDLAQSDELKGSPVIVEGFEGDQDVLSLGDLLSTKVELIQGFGLAKPSPKLKLVLEQSEHEEFERLFTGTARHA
ncbi:MAG: EAL domain-containing protein [Microthrixaceae bacterium]